MHNMTTADQLNAAIGTHEQHLPAYQQKADTIAQRIRGWSNAYHYLFFKAWLDANPQAKSILIIGVYLGRDIAFMLDAAGSRQLRVVGVDKFNAEPCDDWPVEKRGLTWEQAFNCPPPDRELALANINPQSQHDVELVKSDDKVWLESASEEFDLIFLDASHDYAAAARQIQQVRKLCREGTIVSGDDYANVMPTWGVETAVKEAFKSHHHIDYRIWFAGAEDFK